MILKISTSFTAAVFCSAYYVERTI